MAIVEKVTFNNRTSREFGKTVKERVDLYFEENDLSRHANVQMVVKTDHPVPDEENMIDEHWMIHEMVTTNNFARGNKALCWFVGGLNFQIEHHLFPKVCSIHYPAISPIVEQTAKEFNIPYNHHETFFEAVASHYRTLKKFGDPEFSYMESSA